eukprot:Hpha_TRINITY_DN16637_c0_g1::TRINITY_DN16637_c0_g1_i1::g.179119::m.179119
MPTAAAPTLTTEQRLREAGKQGDVAVLRSLLDEHGNDICDASDSWGFTALMWASWHGHAEGVKMLLAAGASVISRDKDGQSALYHAAWNGEMVTVDLLLRGGAEPDAADNEGETPLAAAAAHGHYAVVNLLLTAGADPARADASGREPAQRAEDAGHTAVARALRGAAREGRVTEGSKGEDASKSEDVPLALRGLGYVRRMSMQYEGGGGTPRASSLRAEPWSVEPAMPDVLSPVSPPLPAALEAMSPPQFIGEGPGTPPTPVEDSPCQAAPHEASPHEASPHEASPHEVLEASPREDASPVDEQDDSFVGRPTFHDAARQAPEAPRDAPGIVHQSPQGGSATSSRSAFDSDSDESGSGTDTSTSTEGGEAHITDAVISPPRDLEGSQHEHPLQALISMQHSRLVQQHQLLRSSHHTQYQAPPPPPPIAPVYSDLPAPTRARTVPAPPNLPNLQPKAPPSPPPSAEAPPVSSPADQAVPPAAVDELERVPVREQHFDTMDPRQLLPEEESPPAVDITVRAAVSPETLPQYTHVAPQTGHGSAVRAAVPPGVASPVAPPELPPASAYVSLERTASQDRFPIDIWRRRGSRSLTVDTFKSPPRAHPVKQPVPLPHAALADAMLARLRAVPPERSASAPVVPPPPPPPP